MGRKLIKPTKPSEFPLAHILRTVQQSLMADRSWHPLKHFQAGPSRQSDRRGGIHPSDLAKNCDRALAYSLVNAERERIAPDDKLLRIFDHGHALHAVYQAYLHEAAIQGHVDSFEDEVPVYEESLNIVGTADGLVKDGLRYGIEIKSAGPSTYYSTKDLRKASSPISRPLKYHRQQAHAYMVAGNLNAFFFIYSDKAMDDFSVIYEPFDPECWNPVLKSIHFVQKMVGRYVLPNKTKDTWGCRSCPYKTICDKDTGLLKSDRRQDTRDQVKP